MEKNHFHDLIAYGIYRIQTGHGILENNGYFISTDPSHFLPTHFLDLVSIKLQTAADQLTRICRQSHQTVSCYRLTGTTFSYDAKHLAFLQMNGHII